MLTTLNFFSLGNSGKRRNGFFKCIFRLLIGIHTHTHQWSWVSSSVMFDRMSLSSGFKIRLSRLVGEPVRPRSPCLFTSPGLGQQVHTTLTVSRLRNKMATKGNGTVKQVQSH